MNKLASVQIIKPNRRQEAKSTRKRIILPHPVAIRSRNVSSHGDRVAWWIYCEGEYK